MLLVNIIYLILKFEYKKKFFIQLAQDAIRNDTIAQLLQHRQEYDEREHNRALNEFRALHQQPPAQSIKQKKCLIK
jgi:hypothetical protein